jgi:hypothetical protein
MKMQAVDGTSTGMSMYWQEAIRSAVGGSW